VKCRGFRVRGHGRWSPGARATASSSGRRLGPRRHTGPDATGPLPLPPAASAVHSRRGRRLSGPDPRDLNPPPSFGHFVKDVTGPLLSSSVRLPRGRPKRCVRSGAAASARRMQLLCRPAVSRMACGRNGGGTRRRITTRGMPILNIDQSKSAMTAPDTGARTNVRAISGNDLSPIEPSSRSNAARRRKESRQRWQALS
jgi:hypothetical protein